MFIDVKNSIHESWYLQIVISIAICRDIRTKGHLILSIVLVYIFPDYF